MKVSQTITIDLLKPRKHTVHVMQDGNQRELVVMLLEGDIPYDVTADAGSVETVVMSVRYILPNGYSDEYAVTDSGENAVEQDSTITNQYTVRIDGVATSMHGFADLIVKFSTEDGKVLYSFPITLDVIRSEGEDVDPDGQPASRSRYVRADLQTPATSEMTQPVGYDAETGQLVTAPSGGGGGGTVTGAVRYDTSQSLTTAQKTQARTNIGAGTYSKPSGGVPKTDLAGAVQTSLEHADGSVRFDLTQGLSDAQKTAARQNIGAGTLSSVGAEDILTAAENFTSDQKPVFRGYIGAGTYSKPSGGIPGTDLAEAYLNTSNLTAKTSAMTQAVGYDSSTGKLYTAPGSGGGGISLTVLYAVVDASGNDPVVELLDGDGNDVSYNDFVAALAGAVRITTIPNSQYPNDGWLWYIDDMSATATFVSLHAVVPGQGANTLYTAELTESNGILTGPMYAQIIGTGNAKNPNVYSKTAVNAQTGFTVAANSEYKVSGNPTALKVTNQNAVNGWWRIALVTGSSVDSSNSLVLPSWCYCNETALEANTRYEFICSDDGNVAVGKWSTS